jgi:hypothetical protein
MTEALLAQLVRQGINARISEVPYEFQRGGNEMLVMAAI